MKNQILIYSSRIIVFFLLFISCSCSENSSDIEDNISKQFIKTIQKQNPESWQKGSQFFYNNDKLEYVYLDNCSGELYYFEYNSSGKISKRYAGTTSFNSAAFNPTTFDLNLFKQNSEVLKYVYENDKLVKMQYNDNFIDYQLSYNSDGKVEVIEWLLPSIGLWEKVVFTYANGKISNLNKIEFDSSGGSVTSNYNYTFEYDDNINPFYVLTENSGLLSLYTCTGFDYITSEDMGVKLFKNNITKVYRDGELLYSATYQYDDNKYPTRISYSNLNGNTSGVDVITYKQ